MHWLAIVLLGTIIGSIFIAFARKPLDVIAMPFLLSAIMAFLYIVQPVRGIMSGNLWLYVTPAQATWGILFPAMALATFCLGWFSKARKRFPVKRRNDLQQTATFPSVDSLYRSGIFLAIIGMGLWGYFLIFSGGVTSFYGSVHGAGGRWEDTTAWLYSGIHLVYPGLALMIIALVRTGNRSNRAWTPVVVLIVVMYLHSILTAGRGPFFQLTATVATAFMLASRKRCRISTTIVGMAIGVTVILLLVGYRSALHLGTSIEEFRETKFFDSTATPEGRSSTGVEFAYHTGALATVERLQKYGWGERYLRYLFLHPIPRLWWPSKHRWLHDTNTITKDDFVGVMGWAVATGAAAGLVADWYREWGIFSVIAWYILGASMCVLYKKATRDDASPASMIIYSLVVGCSLKIVLYFKDLPAFVR